MKCANFYDWNIYLCNPHASFNRSPPRILSCHRYPVGRLLSFLLWALVSSGHALLGQTYGDLAIKHLVGFPSYPTGFSGHSTPLNRPVISSTRSVHFAASFWWLFSKARSNQNQRRKKFSYLNQLCSFICTYWAISTLLLSRKRQKAKLAPIREKCKSSRGRALTLWNKPYRVYFTCWQCDVWSMYAIWNFLLCNFYLMNLFFP